MFQLSEDLKAREQEITPQLQEVALSAAHDIALMMADGDKITFNRALAEKAQMLADEFGIRDNHAKKMMNDAAVYYLKLT